MPDEQKQKEELRIQRELSSGRKMIQRGAYLYLYENGRQVGAPINIDEYNVSQDKINELGTMTKDFISVPVSPDFVPVEDYRTPIQKNLQEGIKKQQELSKPSPTIQQEEIDEAPEGGPVNPPKPQPSIIGNKQKEIIRQEEDITRENLRLQEERRRKELERKKKQQLSQ